MSVDVTQDAEIHNGDIVIGYLKMILQAEDVSLMHAMAQAALDFATNDEEALAEGRNYQDAPQ